LHQPVAIDLRYIVAVLKINNDLERIGDLAVNIAERTLYLCEKPVSYPLFTLGTMAQETLAMLRESLDALMTLDADRAREVRVSDDKVDEMNRKMFEQVIDSIRRSPERADCLLSCLSASRSLERIADHATNMAEDVLYMIEGEIVRHKPDTPAPARGGEILSTKHEIRNQPAFLTGVRREAGEEPAGERRNNPRRGCRADSPGREAGETS
jgi:phosphate transport system protein